MLKRILEPEVMDTQAEAIAYDDMDHREVNERFVEDLLSAIEDSSPSSPRSEWEVLDLGTGTARIPILLCQATEDLRIFAVDLSIEMLDVARLNIELSSNTERIMLGHCDAKQLEIDDNRFQVVISNSIIHHVPDPRSTFSEAVRVCKPEGMLFFRDLMRPSSDDDVRQLVETYAGSEAEEAQKMFDDSLRAAFTLSEIRDFVAELGFSPDTVQATSDRHWTWCATKN